MKILMIPTILIFLSLKNLAHSQESEAKSQKQPSAEHLVVKEKKLSKEPGSATVIAKDQLEIFKYTDLNRALKAVPGVQIQEEDGFGLRPNIGMRGAHPHRSRKILIMEDGIPSGPAPYAAPAAYYVPDMSLMEGIEVTKGPAAVRYGPQTIAGAINLLSKKIPDEPLLLNLDIAGGSFGFRKTIGSVSGKVERFSWMLLGADTGTDGFKSLPDGGKTGFHKRQAMAKFHYQLVADQSLQVKLGWANEYSPETYLGLSQQDFATNPYQRYQASSNDHMQASHRNFLVEHLWTGANGSSRVAAYQSTFERNWSRLNSFTDPSITFRKILRQPFGENQHAYDILKGTDDSLGSNDQLLVAHNNRTFYSQGIAWEGSTRWTLESERSNELEWGLRAHEDGIRRRHTSDTFRLESGAMLPSGDPTQTGTQNRYDAQSLAAFVWNTYRQNDWRFSTGLRQEFIDVKLNDLGTANEDSKSRRTAVMPSLGVFHQTTPELGWLFGVYRGMGLALADDEGDSNPEESLNYEGGIRWNRSTAMIDAIGFWNDYKNIKGTCSASEGCSTIDRDLSVDGGKARIYGLELNASFTGLWGGAYWPFAIQYTLTRAHFNNSFRSVLEDWGIGTIQKGDPMPYVPQHLFNVQAGVRMLPFQFNAQWKYQSLSYDQALAEDRLEVAPSKILDISASYFTSNDQEIYANIENTFNAVSIVSYRPFGARPGKPRTFILGTKFSL